MNVKWSESDKNFIKRHAASMSDKEIAEKLTKISNRKVTLDAARKMRQILGIKKARGRGICKLDQDQDE